LTTLVDTSAWVEYLRATETSTHRQLRALLADSARLQTTDVVVMEVLAGARSEAHAAELSRLLGRCEFVPTQGLADFEMAAMLYRQCRRAGETVRALTDCLIAAVAIRADLSVLHADKDFETLERHTKLRCHPPVESPTRESNGGPTD
jgi:predicted nucleic acid-binding protein